MFSYLFPEYGPTLGHLFFQESLRKQGEQMEEALHKATATPEKKERLKATGLLKTQMRWAISHLSVMQEILNAPSTWHIKEPWRGLPILNQKPKSRRSPKSVTSHPAWRP